MPMRDLNTSTTEGLRGQRPSEARLSARRLPADPIARSLDAQVHSTQAARQLPGVHVEDMSRTAIEESLPGVKWVNEVERRFAGRRSSSTLLLVSAALRGPTAGALGNPPCPLTHPIPAEQVADPSLIQTVTKES
jgi:hypothetical protein